MQVMVVLALFLIGVSVLTFPIGHNACPFTMEAVVQQSLDHPTVPMVQTSLH
jgi:hypothetical protein